ncbi:protein phosphatase PrpC [gamma proteobacterium HTCC5015]|nr:protein phosphatase PrpC [gamma proteobacterium HTCC5015]
MALTDDLEMVALSDTGVTREHNEDSVYVETELRLAVLADGMGGYKAGEVASALTVNTIISELTEAQDNDFQEHLENELGLSPQASALEAAIQASNSLVYRTQKNNEECQGMGTTVVAALFYDDGLAVAHTGDSRLYRVREGQLEQLTTDHTLLQELIERGFYTPEEARESLNKNLVTRALGIDPKVAVDVHQELASPDDIYLLCSDGLNDMIEDAEILLTLQEFSANLGRAAQELINRANANGGKDNVSVALVKVPETSKAQRGWLTKVSNWFFN